MIHYGEYLMKPLRHCHSEENLAQSSESIINNGDWFMGI